MIFSKFFQRVYNKYFHRKNDKLCLTLEGKNARAGYLFILPFLIGFTAFMLLPIFESFRMVFSKITLDIVNYGFKIDFIKFENLREALFVTRNLTGC